MKQHSFTTRLKSLVVVFGITIAFASCVNDDIAQNNKTATEGDKNLTTFSTGAPTTRTTMDADGTFYWEAGDKIYVKDDDGNWNASSNAPTGKTASFKFMVPGKYTAHNSYEVYYPGKNGSNDQVTISAAQTQTEPNTTKHFGESGDCGMAKATRIGTNQQFSFTLDHKAAYLVFQPYTSNTILQNCFLTGIEVSSDNDITDTYTLDPNTGKLTGIGNGKEINITTKDPAPFSVNEKGFPLTNTSASLTTNGTYVIIKPGVHKLQIRYRIKDYTTGVEGTVTKDLSPHQYEGNTYYNILGNLNVKDYPGIGQYYSWDAKKHYWYGYESEQPTEIGGVHGHSGNYPTLNTDPRYGAMKTFPGEATESCKDCPNLNELIWYIQKGDPHSDTELWTSMGHLYKGGVWFKKQSVIATENSKNISDLATAAPDNVDYTQVAAYDLPSNVGTNNNITTGRPSNLADYFFLPYLGAYYMGYLLSNGIGTAGYFWSRTVSYYNYSGDDNFCFTFSENRVSMWRTAGGYIGARIFKPSNEDEYKPF